MNWDDYSIVKPARIVEYFPETQTATIQISNTRTYNTSVDSEVQKVVGELKDVPVHTAQGGGWAMTFPIKPGDTCLMLFSQFGYDHWLWEDKDAAGELATNPMPWTQRRFSVRDGLAMVGFNPIPKAIADYNPTDSEWRNADVTQFITLEENGDITVTSPGLVTVNADTADINVATSMTVDCPTTVWTGDIQIIGDITGSGDYTRFGNVSAVFGDMLCFNVNAVTSVSTGALTATTAVVGGLDFALHVHSNGNNGNPTGVAQ